MNIALISNNSKLLKVVAHSVAMALDMFYVDAEEFIEYDLVEKERALQACTKEYLLMREQKAMQTICSYENTLILISEDMFIDNQATVLAWCKTVYVNAPHGQQTSKQIVNKIKTVSRIVDLKFVNYIVNIKQENTEEIVNQIVSLFKNGSKS